MEAHYPQFDRLSREAQDALRAIAGSIFRRWAPRLNDEAKDEYMEDLAPSYARYGYSVMDDAVRELRQSFEGRFPSIPNVREACALVIGRQSAIQSSAKEMEMDAFKRHQREHPEEHIPIAYISSVVDRKREIRNNRAKAGNPVSEEELDEIMLTEEPKMEQAFLANQARLKASAKTPKKPGGSEGRGGMSGMPSAYAGAF